MGKLNFGRENNIKQSIVHSLKDASVLTCQHFKATRIVGRRSDKIQGFKDKDNGKRDDRSCLRHSPSSVTVKYGTPLAVLRLLSR